MFPPQLAAWLARPLVRLVGAGVVLAIAALGLWWTYSAITAAPKAEAKLAKDQAQAATQNGADAVNVVGSNAASEVVSADLTRSNTDEIRKADGASVPVAAGVNDAGLRALCRRAAYSGNPKCMLHVDSR